MVSLNRIAEIEFCIFKLSSNKFKRIRCVVFKTSSCFEEVLIGRNLTENISLIKEFSVRFFTDSDQAE